MVILFTIWHYTNYNIYCKYDNILTIFPLLCISSLRFIYFATGISYLLISLTHFTHHPIPPSSASCLFVLCICESVPIWLRLFFCFVFQISHTSEIIWYLYFSNLFHLV